MPDPTKTLAELLKVREATERANQEGQDRMADLVIRARREGASWEAIGQVLGVSRQSAWERYSPLLGE